MGIRRNVKRISFLGSLLTILMLCFVPSLCAETYYADVTIVVDSAGFVTIDGVTNHPDLVTENTELYTIKQQSYWVLNITKPQTFSEFVYVLSLPEGSEINYIRSSGSITIKENQGTLIVTGFGENESLSILVQYQTEKREGSLLQGNVAYFILIPSIIIVSIFLVYLLFKEKKTKSIKETDNTIVPQTEWKGLNHRQRQIMQLLQERNTPLTQTDIQRELQIPKASVSRNIHGLERQGLIEKEQIGMSNLIRLKKL